MTYEEMSNFTWGELSHFTYYELSLDKAELLSKILEDESNIIPEDILDKIRAMCINTIDSVEKSSGSIIPQKIKDILSQPKVSQALLTTVLKVIIKIIASSLISSGIKSISIDNVDFHFTKEQVKTTYYFYDGNFNNDIDVIIKEIKTTTNIDISLDDVNIESN